MPFDPPQWLPALSEIPHSVTLEQFVLDSDNSHRAPKSSHPALVCGVTGKSYDLTTVRSRVDCIARSLRSIPVLQSSSVESVSEWNKVVAIYSLNTIDYILAALAVHRIGGVVTTVSAAYTPSQLEVQLAHARATVVFTCQELLSNVEAVCEILGISKDCVFILQTPGQDQEMESKDSSYLSVDDLVTRGPSLPPMRHFELANREGERRTAVLAYSSGTSGLPKGLMLSHRNLIAQIMQSVNFESIAREEHAKDMELRYYREACLCVVPISHILGFIQISLISMYRGDTVVVLPKYDLDSMMQAVERYRIARLYLVPPMIIDIIRNGKRLKEKYDLSSVRSIFTGAAPLGAEPALKLTALFPKWAILNAYGLTECAGGMTFTSPKEVCLGSCGSLASSNRIQLRSLDGMNEITGHDYRGEIYLRGPSVFLGYYQNEAANREVFVELDNGCYMRTGDEAMIKCSKSGNEHVFITDRIKECVTLPLTLEELMLRRANRPYRMIKVKGIQVAPAELEAHLLSHPAISDCAVIGVPAEREGEVLKAFVVLTQSGQSPVERHQLKEDILAHVRKNKPRYYWLDKGGIEFVDRIPKSASGKILRRILREQERSSVP